MATKPVGVEDCILLCFSNYNNVRWNQSKKNTHVTGNQVGSNEVLNGWNYLSLKNNGINFKIIHFNMSIKLDMQDVRERIQGSDRVLILPTSSTFISLLPKEFILTVLRLFLSLLSSDMHVHVFRTLY